ncbi:MAG: T9SS type A sorting domain-containing protein [Bacteroidetes bacterium]|nr:T9SS type A sorting domain-containing protein [Bacteroidota bacterium]
MMIATLQNFRSQISGVLMLVTFFISCNKKQKANMPPPTSVVNLLSEEERETRFENWYDWLHKTAPGTNWKKIEEQNMLTDAALKQSQPMEMMDAFANGQIQATWSERGSLNQAGRCIALDYYKPLNRIYTIGDGGALYRGVPDSSNWISVNHNYKFNNRVLKVVKNNNNQPRIITAVGENILYSDNNGTSFNTSTGISFPVSWGGNFVHQVVGVDDSLRTLYAVTRAWDSGPWAPRYWLYRSTNKGNSWTKIFTFNSGSDNRLQLWVPYGSTKLVYALTNESGGSTSMLYEIKGINVAIKNTSNQLPVNTNLDFKGIKVGTKYLFFALCNNSVYKSNNFGANWALMGTTPENVSVMGVSIVDSNRIFTGGVNAFRSYNGGLNFTKINEWWEYYSNINGKLHADLFNFQFYKRNNGTEFGIINCDGGMWRSENYLSSVTNISLTGLNISQYYDVLYDPSNSNYMYAGSQDQGFQRSNTALVPGKINFEQVISGDYGKMQLTRNNQTLWTEYPGGSMYYYYNKTGPLSATYSLPGSTKPLYGWMLATARAYPLSNNKIYMGGGNINGGSGSYIATLTGSSNAISATQINYDFRANSSNGTSGIAAIATTPVDANRIYVTTEDGTIFYSTNAGSSWTKNSSFTGPGPFYITGNALLASKKNANTVWLGGAGYNNPAVYVSANGGANFTAITNGLPATLVFDLEANADETVLYAATEAGPYAYIVADNMWYNIRGTKAAYQSYFAVDMDTTANVVHFASYGRGIWDFKITSSPMVANPVSRNSMSTNSADTDNYHFPESLNLVNLHSFAAQQLIDDFTIFDLNGKVLINANSSPADVQALPAAVYLVRVQIKGKNFVRKMAIIIDN